MSISFQEMKIF